MDLKVMNKISYGLFILTARDGTKDNGCVINTAMQVTANPKELQLPLISPTTLMI